MTELVRKAEIEILRYLIAHEDARDTIEGIEKWWLPPAEYGVGDVALALRDLEQQRLIRVWNVPPATPVYGRALVDSRVLEDYIRELELKVD